MFSAENFWWGYEDSSKPEPVEENQENQEEKETEEDFGEWEEWFK